LIFPEFENLKRLERLEKICDYTQVNNELILAVLLIDEKNNHEYFTHKYNVSNDIKENLHLLAKNLTQIKGNKDFFKKDLEKNIYLNDKKHLINLNILNFVINEKIKLKGFSDTLKKILQSKNQKFPVDGKYLMDNGMKQGSQMGKVLKKIEEEWIKNNFQISEDQMKEIIRLHSN
jgi:tRNA nucleotidyltransferase/poly(A) polymerase